MKNVLIASLLTSLFASTLLAHPAQDPFQIARYLPFAEGGSLRLVADLDGNGADDLLFFPSPNQTGAGSWIAIETWMNDGAMGFTMADSVTINQSGAPAAISQPLVGDITGDGNLDVVLDYRGASNNPNNRMEVIPGNGDGTFGTPIPFVNAFVWDYELGQVDQDPALEVGVFHSDPGFDRILSWFDFDGVNMVNLGSLSLTPQASMRALAVTDVNDDGIDDLIAAESSPPDRLTFFPTQGGAPTRGASFLYPGAILNVNQHIRTGDLDDDGLEDVLVVTRDVTVNETYFLRYMQVSAGVFSVQPLQTLADPVFPFIFNSRSMLVDWDDDGDLDLSTGGGIVTLFENDGSNFLFGSDEYSGGSQFWAGIGDFNGDGKPDFADQKSVVLGRGDFTTVQRLAAPYPINDSFHEIADWEGDGDTDIINSSFGVEVNDATGNFTTTLSLLPTPPANHVFNSFGASGYGDFNGDGRKDWVMGLEEVIQQFPPITEFKRMVLIADKGGRLDHEQPAATDLVEITDNSGDPWPSGDLDEDGDQDIVSTGGYWDNDGTGFFTGFVSAFAGTPLLVADLDGNGKDDVVTVQGLTLKVRYNQGGLSFNSQTLGLVGSDRVLTLVDLDGDTDRDLAVASAVNDEILLFENLGASFGVGVNLAVTGLELGPVGVLDWDQDGLLDVAIGRRPNSFFTVLNVFPRTGPGLTYGAPVEWITRTVRTAFFDVDEDGDVDAVGRDLIENVTFDGPDAGVIRQYGVGNAGSDGIVPVFGVAGPLRPGETASVRIVRAVGGTRGLIAIGLNEASIPLGPGKPTLLVTPILLTFPFKTTGGTGIPADGEWTLDYPVDPAWAGARVFEQAFLFDPTGLTATNGVEFVYGL